MFFAFNEALDFMVIRPVAVTYRYIVPTGVRNTVRNFLRNLRSPVTLANDLFQGDLERAEITFTRFFINSTIGMLGLFDIAADSGFPYHEADFRSEEHTSDLKSPMRISSASSCLKQKITLINIQ